MGKIKTLFALQKEILKLKRQNKTIVFTNGCFDIIHPGHIKILKTAKSAKNILIVGLNSDSSIKEIKGKTRPIFKEKARIQILESIEFVDFIILFKEKTPYNLIKTLKPDILVKGGDWKKGQIVGNNIAKKVVRIKLQKGYSTSKIIKKIIKTNT